jgi:hypothetical protein
MRKADESKVSSRESPVTKMFLSADGQWLAAVNCFGDIYVFNLEVQRYATVFTLDSLPSVLSFYLQSSIDDIPVILNLFTLIFAGNIGLYLE